MRKKISELTDAERAAWKSKKTARNAKASIAVLAAGALLAVFRDNQAILIIMLVAAVVFLVYAIYVPIAERTAGVDVDKLNIPAEPPDTTRN